MIFDFDADVFVRVCNFLSDILFPVFMVFTTVLREGQQQTQTQNKQTNKTHAKREGWVGLLTDTGLKSRFRFQSILSKWASNDDGQITGPHSIQRRAHGFRTRTVVISIPSFPPHTRTELLQVSMEAGGPCCLAAEGRCLAQVFPL